MCDLCVFVCVRKRMGWKGEECVFILHVCVCVYVREKERDCE